MVVDEDDIENIKPLPNLDYKIVCGNSLLGVEKNLFNQFYFEKLEELKPQYFNSTQKSEKRRLKKEIDEIIKELTKDNSFDFEIYFSEVFHEKGGFDVVIGNPPYITLVNAYNSFKQISSSLRGKEYLAELLKTELYWLIIDLKHQITGLSEEERKLFLNSGNCDFEKAKFNECFAKLDLDSVRNCRAIDKIVEAHQHFYKSNKYRLHNLTQVIIPNLKNLAITSDLKYYLDLLLVNLLELNQIESFVTNALMSQKQIEKLAHEIYEERLLDKEPGSPLGDWLKAEEKLSFKNEVNFAYNIFFNEFYGKQYGFIAFAEKVWDLLTAELLEYNEKSSK
ncbi:MAG: DUF2934 domain-containing protein [Candidatus Gastranaerophilales bacterium]|nr:DUF2934 domain-containing protein [Candidatus Gastranaerophilales bacterium]